MRFLAALVSMGFCLSARGLIADSSALLEGRWELVGYRCANGTRPRHDLVKKSRAQATATIDFGRNGRFVADQATSDCVVHLEGSFLPGPDTVQIQVSDVEASACAPRRSDLTLPFAIQDNHLLLEQPPSILGDEMCGKDVRSIQVMKRTL